MAVRWNLASTRRRNREADAFVISLPKSGRTWLRVLLCAYACRARGRDVEVRDEVLRESGLPLVRYTHDLWEHRTARRLWDRLRGRFLVTGADRHKPIVYLVRDPRDLMVSLYFQESKRSGRFAGDLPAFLRDRLFGVDAVVATMNAWYAEWAGRSHVLLVRYEDCRADTAGGLTRILDHLGVASVDPEAVAAAVAYADFGRMREREARGEVEAGYLKAADPADPESFKARRGKVGGYRDYLSPEDIAWMESRIAVLHPDLGYAEAPRPG